MSVVAFTLTPPAGSEPECLECGTKVTAIHLGTCGKHAELEPCGCVLTKNEINDLLEAGR